MPPVPEIIKPADLIPMDVFCAVEPIKIDLVYANLRHPENIFSSAPYHANSRLILHRDMAAVVLKTARELQKKFGWALVLKDGLRTIEAQKILMNTDVVRNNPQWLEEPRLLSAPGQGAHPRGMAIDVSLEDTDGAPVDMGTVFDCMTVQSARNYEGFSGVVSSNRKALEKAFVEAARSLSLPLLPLPSEWWDFRFPASHYNRYAPLSDEDLPAPLKMTVASDDSGDFAGLAKSILMSL